MDLKNSENIEQIGKLKNLEEIRNIGRNWRYLQPQTEDYRDKNKHSCLKTNKFAEKCTYLLQIFPIC
jgi:hypothetical protein